MTDRQLIKAEEYAVITFVNPHHALHAEKVLEDAALPFLTVPAPRELSEGCGLAMRVFGRDLLPVTKALRANEIGIAGVYRAQKSANGQTVYTRAKD